MKGVAKLRAGVGEVGLLEAPEPNASPGHLVIEVTAGGLCGTDVHIFHDEYPSRPPVILGHEVAGKVVDVGEGVTRTFACAECVRIAGPGCRITADNARR